nr:permease prefix domain 1-containing protein [Haloechinothrix aidingensis]
MIADVRAHLEDMVAESQARGTDRAPAEREAIERFGDPVVAGHRLRSTATLVYEEAVRSACFGLLVLCAIWVLPGTPLPGWLPAVVALVAYPVGLGLRVWERRRHVHGEHVPPIVTRLNGSTAGYAVRVLAALGAVAVLAAPAADHYAGLGPAVAAGLALVAAGWVLTLATRLPRVTAPVSRRHAAGAMLGVAVLPMGLYVTLLAADAWPSYDPAGDGRVISCDSDGEAVTATVRITNHDDEPHGYLYSPEVVHRDRTIAHLTDTSGFVPVEPGQTVTMQYSGVPRHPATGERQPLPGSPEPVPEHFTCRAGQAELERDLHGFLP